MLITLDGLLSPEDVRRCNDDLRTARWKAGRHTAGHVAAAVKRNQQLAPDDPTARELGARILAALGRDPRFQSAALPARILPPRFNRYRGGEHYGWHIDNAVFRVPGSADRLRADVSTTVFLSDPDDYDGGELCIQDAGGERRVKLPAGCAAVYPANCLHCVAPVTRGTRLAAFFWTQSLVREEAQRALLLEQDLAIQQLIAACADPAAITRLTGVYHNLVRRWAAD